MSPFIGERVINHSKDVPEETYDLWDYFDEKRDALERLIGLHASVDGTVNRSSQSKSSTLARTGVWPCAFTYCRGSLSATF